MGEKSFWSEVTELSQRPNPTRGGHVLVVEEGGQLRRIDLDRELVVGRGLGVDVLFESGGISRRHAKVGVDANGQVWVEDLSSANGTFVNGAELKERAHLKVGDRISLGGAVELLLSLRDDLWDRAVQAQKLETLGRLTGGVAHDFNNVLTSIIGSLGLVTSRLRRRAGDDVEIQDCIADIQRAIDAAGKSSETIRRLLEIASGGDGEHETSVVDVAVLLETGAELASRPRPRVEIVVDHPEGLSVAGDAAQLHQVVMNLVINACDATQQGEIRLWAKGETRGGSAGVRIGVTDSGCGMDPSVARRATDPFFTTKGTGRGSGLGLAMAKKIIANHGGALDIESAPNKGTTVSIWLPSEDPRIREKEAADQAARSDTIRIQNPLQLLTETQERPRPGPRSKPAGRVLVIDDDKTVLRSISELLSRLGYGTEMATTGEEALELLRKGPTPSLVLLDLGMPGMGGMETARHIRQEFPDIPVIVVSGLLEPAVAKELQSIGIHCSLTKPFNAYKLGRAVVETANRAPSSL